MQHATAQAETVPVLLLHTGSLVPNSVTTTGATARAVPWF